MGHLFTPSQYNVVHLLDRPGTTVPDATVTYSVANVGTAKDPIVVAEELHNLFIIHWLSHVDSQATIESTSVYEGPSPSVLGAEFVDSTAGLRATASVSPQVALLIHKRTVFLGRQNRGRMYMPHVLPSANVGEGGAITQSVVDALQTSADNWLAEMDLDQYQMVITHSDPLTTLVPDVESLVVDSTVGTQRRRVRR